MLDLPFQGFGFWGLCMEGLRCRFGGSGFGRSLGPAWRYRILPSSTMLRFGLPSPGPEIPNEGDKKIQVSTKLGIGVMNG